MGRSANYRWRFSPLVDSSGSDKYTSWLPSNDPARKGRQHRCRSKAGRPTRPSRHKKDTAVRVSTTRQQGLAFRQTSSWSAPRAGHLKRTSLLRTSPSRTTWTSHKKGSGTKAPQPRVARRRRGATLGILNLLGSGYEFQGWHFSEKRERGNDSGWQSLTRVCRTHHELLRSFGVMRHAQPASARSRTPGPHIAFGSWTLAGQQHHSSTDLH